ncbi:MAG: hypothetical protein B6U94_02960 [Thermofilum sp. ex4484_79]|nr:MAG: hypothetical protein B6U94_02960 [Thermofilum sp. ex4484_79]
MSSITSRKARGYYTERKLVKLLSRNRENYVFRVPVSGSRSSENAIVAFPDVFLVNNKKDLMVAFEVKSTIKNNVKVRKSQIIKLAKFLHPFKKYRFREIVVAVWFIKEGKWVFRKVDNLLELGNYLVIKSSDKSNWLP